MIGRDRTGARVNPLQLGWSYHNPDTGMEWTVDHPIESGQCTDATNVRRMTLRAFAAAHRSDKDDE